MMFTYVARGTFRDLEALRPVLRGGADTYADLRRQLIQFERRRLWMGGFLGFAFICALAELAIGFWTQRILVADWSLRDPCLAVVAFAYWITVGLGAAYLIDSARLYSRIGERYVTVGLLDLAPLAPVTRHGLRIVLLVVILSAYTVISGTVNISSDSSAHGTAVFLIVLCIVVLAAAAFVLPVLGLRRQIRARKAEELSKLRKKIRRDEELVTELGSASAEAGGRLPGLMVLEKRIESVREWPFDAPTLTRFFLYVAIPLGSWVGGALVERLLGAALD
jgi:uncharacterized membrane protein YcjF (UPF0283 family)